MNEVLKNVNDIISFILELAMLIGIGYWGFYGEKSTWMKWLIGIGFPLAAVIIWGLLLAPKATYRLDTTNGVLVSSLLFLLAAIALYTAQQRESAIVFVIFTIINRILVLVWKQW